MIIALLSRKVANSTASQTFKVERKATSNQKERLGFTSKLTSGIGRSSIGVHSNYRSRDKPSGSKISNIHQK